MGIQRERQGNGMEYRDSKSMKFCIYAVRAFLKRLYRVSLCAMSKISFVPSAFLVFHFLNPEQKFL